MGGIGNDDIDGGDGSDVLWGGSEVISFSTFNRGNLADFDYPTNFPGQEWAAIVAQTNTRIVPKVLVGLTVEGQFEDGNDVVRGGTGKDWLFGGGADDTLLAGSGIDYVDGGAGNDRVEGGEGDDVLRGGTNDDILLGGNGIDQLFGDAGSDRVFADAGSGNTNSLTQTLTNQRLFGGDGIDYLYGYSYSTSYVTGNAANHVGTESLLDGDEFHGGAGGDWIYGSLRRETFYGDGGNDTIQGDAPRWPGLRESSVRALNAIGDSASSSDTIYGGTGEDRLYGGGGGDVIWGGSDSDWLEGQDGIDTLYGGSGIDMLLLDTLTAYAINSTDEIFDGHYGNFLPGDAANDDATDILLVEGTDSADLTRVLEAAILATDSLPANGQLSAIASFSIKVGADSPVSLSIAPDTNNSSEQHLIDDINMAIGSSSLNGKVVAALEQNRLVFTTLDVAANRVLAIGIPTQWRNRNSISTTNWQEQSV